MEDIKDKELEYLANLYVIANATNRESTKCMLQAKKSLARTEFLSIITFNNNYCDLLENLDKDCNNCLRELREDKRLIKDLYKLLSKAISFGCPGKDIDNEYFEIFDFIAKKDENITMRFCDTFETALYSFDGITYYSPNMNENKTDSYNEEIQMRLLKLGLIEDEKNPN